MNGASRSDKSLVSRVRIIPAECFSALSAAVCCPGVPMTVTKTSAIERSSLTFTRVMLVIGSTRGSLRSRRIMMASSCWMVLPRRSVLRDISNQLNLVIHQVSCGDAADEIDDLTQRTFDVAGVISHHRHADDRPPMLIKRANLGNRTIVAM